MQKELTVKSEKRDLAILLLSGSEISRESVGPALPCQPSEVINKP